MRYRWLSYLAFVSAVLEVTLAVSSWMLSVLSPGMGVRNLLDGAGIRWFFGHFVSFVSSPVLVWLLVGASAVGCLADSGFCRAIVRLPRLVFRERMALAFSLVALLVYAILIFLLVAAPHGVLLSATGRLYPSPFSSAFIPLLAFGGLLCSVVYGIASGRYFRLPELFRSLFLGIERAAPLFVLYVLVIELCYSVDYIFF